MNGSTAYIGLDVHSRTCTMAWMNEDGTYQGTRTFETSGPNLREEENDLTPSATLQPGDYFLPPVGSWPRSVRAVIF